MERTYTSDEVTTILDILDDIGDIPYRGKGIIDQEMIDQANEEYEGNLLDNFLNYKIKVKTDGDHRNDGQMVDYKFIFKSPEGKKTKFYTEMCLMVGWNHCYEQTIL